MLVQCREWDGTAVVRAVMAAPGSENIQVWRVPVPDDACLIQHRCCGLSRDEIERASRLRDESSRRQFITGRAALRQLLGVQLRVEPSALEFSRQSSGKPGLDPRRWSTLLRFNVSHSKSWVVIALAEARDVGVDIEAMEEMPDWRLLAERVFSAQEWHQMQALTAVQQLEAFYRGWTRKEAYLKATGEGLIDDLSRIQVSMMPGDPPELRALPADAGDPREWTMRSVPMPAGYEGAVVFSTLRAERGRLLCEPRPAASRVG